MAYAKVKGGTLIEYPYGLDQLFAENPYTNYGDLTDPKQVFHTTASAIANGYSLAKVVEVTPPDYDTTTQSIVEQKPVIQGTNWVQQYLRTNLSQADIDVKLEAAKQIQRMAILEGCTDLQKALLGAYPVYEVQSWVQQVEEAKLVKSGTATDENVPFIDGIIRCSEETREHLADTILAKADHHATLLAMVIGQRRLHMKNINSAKTIDEVKAIRWNRSVI